MPDLVEKQMNDTSGDPAMSEQESEEELNDSTDYDKLLIDLLEIMDEVDFGDNDTSTMEEESDD